MIKRIIRWILATAMIMAILPSAMAAADITEDIAIGTEDISYHDLYDELNAIAKARGIELMDEGAFVPELDDTEDVPEVLAISVPSDATTIKEGASSKGTLTAGGEKSFTFKTPSAGAYDIYTSGSTDTYGTLYKKGLTGLSEVEAENGGGTGKNFRLECGLKNNTTYYLKVSGGGGCNCKRKLYALLERSYGHKSFFKGRFMELDCSNSRSGRCIF